MTPQTESKEFQKVDDDIEGQKEVYGATFKLKEFGSSKVFESSFTESEVAAMLIFASGSIEDALNALAYSSQQARKDKKTV